MDIVNKEKFEKADQFKRKEFEKKIDEVTTTEEFNKLLEVMQNPADAQRELAVQVKLFLDKRIKQEIEEKGILSDHTRRWVESYNSILEKLQKSLYGEKTVNLHLHKVTHSMIASKIREAEKEEDAVKKALIVRKKKCR